MPNDFFVHFCWQHNYVFVRHVWKEALVQEVCDLYTSPVSGSSYWHLLIGFQSYFILGSCRAFVFFSSPIARELVMEIKKDAQVLPRIGALREVSVFLFFLVLDGNWIFPQKFKFSYCHSVTSFQCRWTWSILP